MLLSERGPAAATHHGNAQPARTLVLPDVPNVWDQLTSTTEATLGASEDVQYIEEDDDGNPANDAMLLIMHAVQARSQGRSLAEERRASAEQRRSQGRSLTGERRASAEQYWRQAEEQGEAQLFRSSRDGEEEPAS